MCPMPGEGDALPRGRASWLGGEDPSPGAESSTEFLVLRATPPPIVHREEEREEEEELKALWPLC